MRRVGGGVRGECRSEPSTPPPTRLVLVRGDGLSRRPHADEVVFEPLEVRLGHHVRDEEAGEVALLPHPRREAFLVQERGPEPLDLDTPAVGDRQARGAATRAGAAGGAGSGGGVRGSRGRNASTSTSAVAAEASAGASHAARRRGGGAAPSTIAARRRAGAV